MKPDNEIPPAPSMGQETHADEASLHAALRELFAEAGWPEGGDIDSFWFQGWAVKHGMLTPEERFAPCAEDCNCAGYYDPDEFAAGVTCYRKAPWLVENGAPVRAPDA